MICRSNRARLLFALCLVSPGCSSQNPANDQAERVLDVSNADTRPVANTAPNDDTSDDTEPDAGTLLPLSLNGPASVPLGSAFDVTLVRTAPGPVVHADQFDWGGEGLNVTGLNGPMATLTCVWSGYHLLEVSAKALPDSVPITTEIYCSPPLCADSPATCPGVAVAPKDLNFPKTNVLVRVALGHDCPGTLPASSDTGGGWVGGFLIDIPDASDEPGGRICSYTWQGLPTQPPSAPLLPEGAWQWDSPRIGAQGTANQLNEALARHGQEELGTLNWSSGPTVPVRIAVVDTAADTWTDPDNNPHGKAVGLLAFDTACGRDSNCNVTAWNYLGLPLYREELPNSDAAIIRRDIVHGGSFGAHGDLVRALLDAVNSAPSVRTVLNLSVAYEAPELVGTLRPATTDFANRAVLTALHRARCGGALIIAAAGNGPVPADPNQMAGFPARWAALPALSKDECTRRFKIAKFRDTAAPLLYPASALDYAGQPLLSTRGNGQSTFAALGFQAVRQLPSGAYTRRLTGSSMATAALSGIAASLWSHSENLAPDAVMRALYTNGTATALPADFGPFPAGQPGVPAGEVRRITRCSIASAFPKLAQCSLPAPNAAVPPGTVPPLPAGSDKERGIAPVPFTAGLRPEDVPWLFPQPSGEPGCGACSLAAKFLNLAFRPSFPVLSVRNMKLIASPGVSVTVEAQVPSPQLPPFSVNLGNAFPVVTAGELTYQIDFQGIPIDATESVIIE